MGITKGVNYALTKLGEKIESLEELEKFIGPPLHESFPLFTIIIKSKLIKLLNTLGSILKILVCLKTVSILE